LPTPQKASADGVTRQNCNRGTIEVRQTCGMPPSRTKSRAGPSLASKMLEAAGFAHSRLCLPQILQIPCPCTGWAVLSHRARARRSRQGRSDAARLRRRDTLDLSERGPRDATALLDIEHALNKLEKVALRYGRCGHGRARGPRDRQCPSPARCTWCAATRMAGSSPSGSNSGLSSGPPQAWPGYHGVQQRRLLGVREAEAAGDAHGGAKRSKACCADRRQQQPSRIADIGTLASRPRTLRPTRSTAALAGDSPSSTAWRRRHVGGMRRYRRCGEDMALESVLDPWRRHG